jgi:hypothetical protein
MEQEQLRGIFRDVARSSLEAVSYMHLWLARLFETRFDCGSHPRRFKQHRVYGTASSTTFYQ